MRDIINEDSLILKKRFLYICENNLAAALLLDEFEDDAHTETACAELDDRDKRPLLYTNEALASRLCNLFSTEEISQACIFLAAKQFITWRYRENNSNPLTTRPYYVKYEASFVGIASQPYLEEKMRLQYERFQKTSQQNQSISVGTDRDRKIKLENKYKIENSRVLLHNNRAKKMRLPATLTLEQWITTLNHFNWTCAFCQGEYTVLEHFIPLIHGDKGTSKDNCVPSCRSCNLIKGPYHPSALSSTAQEQLGIAVQVVQKYLKTLSDEVAE